MLPIAKESFTPANIEAYERQMAKAPQVDMSDRVRFVYGTGTACKIGEMKKGELILGKYHREATVNHLQSGSIMIATDSGGRVYHAPDVFISPPGCRKLGLALTDVVFTNTHATDQIAPESIEQELICVRVEDLELPKPALPPQGLCPAERETLISLLNRYIITGENCEEAEQLMGEIISAS